MPHAATSVWNLPYSAAPSGRGPFPVVLWQSSIACQQGWWAPLPAAFPRSSGLGCSSPVEEGRRNVGSARNRSAGPCRGSGRSPCTRACVVRRCQEGLHLSLEDRPGRFVLEEDVVTTVQRHEPAVR